MIKHAMAKLFFLFPLLFVSCDCGEPEVKKVGFGEACESTEDCKGDLVCEGSVCVECLVADDCSDNEVCQDDKCVVDCPQSDRCEIGGSCCPGDYDCVNNHCRPPCSGDRCGHNGTMCCASGQVCEQERCIIDCGARDRCGQGLDACCGDGDICYGFSCTSPGRACVRQADCDAGQVCEVDLGICIDELVIGTCEYHPPSGVFSPDIECRWTPPVDQVTPGYDDVVMAPVVANLTDDNGDGRTDLFDTPDLVFASYDLATSCCNVDATLRIVSGGCHVDGTMVTHASIAEPAIDNSAGIALGDLDGDGVPEIVAILNNGGQPQGTVVFKRGADDGTSWNVYWRNDDYPTWNVHTRGGAQPALADITGDQHPEVIIGNVVLNWRDGTLLWDGVVTSGGSGGIGNNAFLGPVSTVADIDLDNEPEVIAGNTVYSADGQVDFTYTYTTDNSLCTGHLPCDGYTGVANFDDDDFGEVVIVRRGEVFVINHDQSLLFQAQLPVDDCLHESGDPNNEAGPPTIADFDNDGRVEVGTAAADYYVVVDLDCVGNPLPAGCQGEGILWAVANRDCSSRVTASSVFDFDGDGAAEVIYADETTFRILDGSTGAALYTDSTHGSHTRLEMAVIADVDNDGNAEVVIAENGSGGGTPGVEIWGDADDNWVYTRRVWNQHSYHVTNTDELGQIPSAEPKNWLDPYLNNFRQNTQGEGVFWAPDLVVVNVEVVCQTDLTLTIAFAVMNQGSRMVGINVPITIYIGGHDQHTVHTTQNLFPGQAEHFSWSWTVPENLYHTSLNVRVVADDFGDGSGSQNECENGGEDNNEASEPGTTCGPAG